MITIRRATQRQHIGNRKQEVRLSFYPEDKSDLLSGGFGVLQIFGEIRLAPGAAMAPQPPQDAELFTYMLQGALAQEDTAGYSGVVLIGEFQRLTTGLRVRLTERNGSEVSWAHFFRMSLQPSETERKRSSEQKFFSVAERRGSLRIVGSPDGRRGSLRVQHPALIFSSILDEGQHIVHQLPAGRIAWLHVVSGEANLGDLILQTGDGVGVVDEPAVSFTAREETEILLVELDHRPGGTQATNHATENKKDT